MDIHAQVLTLIADDDLGWLKRAGWLDGLSLSQLHAIMRIGPERGLLQRQAHPFLALFSRPILTAHWRLRSAGCGAVHVAGLATVVRPALGLRPPVSLFDA